MVELNYEGIETFRSVGCEDFPVKCIYYRGQYLIVPDWSIHHDPGDEDDGEHKAIMKALKEKGIT